MFALSFKRLTVKTLGTWDQIYNKHRMYQRLENSMLEGA